jgi:HEPN domain-containing protein
MQNRELAADHVRRAQVRIRALDLLFDADSWADVVRESQEALELALKGLLRAYGVDPPRAHDVSDVLLAERERLPIAIRGRVDELAAASRDLRRDRELSFYGAEDLTPSLFYERKDAERAREMARDAVRAIAAVVLDQGRESQDRHNA